MIFIINETNHELKLKASEQHYVTTLSVLVDNVSLDIVSTTDKEISKAMKERFGESETIRNSKSRHNFRLNNSVTFLNVFPPSNEGEPTGLDGTARMFRIEKGEQLEKYSASKDMIVVVHRADDSVSMNDQDTNWNITVASEQHDVVIDIFMIKWYNWSKLKTPVYVYINNKREYMLSAIPHKTIEGKTVNAVTAVRKRKKPQDAAE